MKKIVAGAAVAAALVLGTSVPAEAAPRAVLVGQACQTYKEELVRTSYFGADYRRTVYRIAADTYTSCRYNTQNYDSRSDRTTFGSATYAKIRPAAGGGK